MLPRPETPAVAAARQLSWLADAEDRAISWIITNRLPEYLAEVQPRRAAELAKTRELVTKRLEGERDRLLLDAAVDLRKNSPGPSPKSLRKASTARPSNLTPACAEG